MLAMGLKRNFGRVWLLVCLNLCVLPLLLQAAAPTIRNPGNGLELSSLVRLRIKRGTESSPPFQAQKSIKVPWHQDVKFMNKVSLSVKDFLFESNPGLLRFHHPSKQAVVTNMKALKQNAGKNNLNGAIAKQKEDKIKNLPLEKNFDTVASHYNPKKNELVLAMNIRDRVFRPNGKTSNVASYGFQPQTHTRIVQNILSKFPQLHGVNVRVIQDTGDKIQNKAHAEMQLLADSGVPVHGAKSKSGVTDSVIGVSKPPCANCKPTLDQVRAITSADGKSATPKDKVFNWNHPLWDIWTKDKARFKVPTKQRLSLLPVSERQPDPEISKKRSSCNFGD